MIRSIVLAAAALLAACSATSDSEPKGPGDFAFSAPVEPNGSATLQRIEVPAAALAALKRDDEGDIRLFDADGKALSLARFDPVREGASESHTLPVYPIARAQTDGAGPTVAIEVAQPGQTISLETGGAAVAADSDAALVDTRALEDPAIAVVLDAEVPAQTPVTFTLEASGDLKSWEALGDKVLFTPSAGQAPLGSSRVALAGADLHDRYLRLSWKRTNGVAVHGVSVLTSKTVPPPRGRLATSGAELDDAHNILFSLAGAAPIAAIEVTGSPADGVVPLRLYGRDSEEQPWQPISAATLQPGARPAVLELNGNRHHQYRIEADRRSAGFSKVPAIALEIEPLTLIAAFNGEAPYRLATGHELAETNMFAASELADAKALAGDLPLAKVEAGEPAAIALESARPDSPFAPRKLALWAALLLGTAVLGYGAVRLLKANQGAS